MLLSQGVLALGASVASATTLWIADYSGIITTAALTEFGGKYTFNETSTTDKCAPNPSWLTVDANRGLMFCLQESIASLTDNGTVVSSTIEDDGALDFVKQVDTLNGPVSGAIYGHASGQRGLVAAHYGGSAVTTYLLHGSGAFETHEVFTFALDKPGPDADNQAAPHAHEAVLDPTGQYILVPDLGADLVRVFAWDADTLKLTALESLSVTPGYGPRHLAFWTPRGVVCEGCTTQMYLVGELAGMVTSFDVTYMESGAGLNFTNITASVTQADNPKNRPAEIEISTDGRYLVVSNRDASGTDSTASTKSTLATYCLHEDGSLEPEPKLTTNDAIAHGYPRHFSMNKDGSLVAVGLQFLNSTIILSRDVSTGDINPEPVAQLDAPGPVTNVMWNE